MLTSCSCTLCCHNNLMHYSSEFVLWSTIVSQMSATLVITPLHSHNFLYGVKVYSNECPCNFSLVQLTYVHLAQWSYHFLQLSCEQMIAGFLCICRYKSTKLPWRASLLLPRSNKGVECHITTDATFFKYVTPYKSCKSRIGCTVLVVPPLRQYQLEYIRKEYYSASALWHFLIFVFINSVLYTCITSQHVPAVLCILWKCFALLVQFDKLTCALTFKYRSFLEFRSHD